MHLLFTPNHIQLCNACYPPSSALLTSGPDYSPNSQELSRLTYYASNHPGKLNKLGSELEKRVKAECRKAQAGNTRTRAALLITLSIIRSLATECRRDITLLSPSLISAVDTTLGALPSDLEVIARAASVFTAWTTYTDGHLIGADRDVTNDYLSVLRRFAALSSVEAKTPDHEVRNRTRLVGFAAITGALTSEALYNDSTQFKAQISIIMRPLLVTLLQTDLAVLNQQATAVKDTPISPYLAEFRTRPALERRAVSIHIHIDGDKGPSMSDVSNACLHALYSLLEHANGSQLGHIMRSICDSLDELKGWESPPHCCWIAEKATEWSQFQYRYAVPTWLVERLLENQDSPVTTPLHTALAAMITTVFNSPTPLVNLSTSDIISNLITLLLRRTAIDPEDTLLSALVECVSSLGSHVYYSDQIQDLAGELISRLVLVEVQSIVGRGHANAVPNRSQAVRCLLAGLLGLIQVADKNDDRDDRQRKSIPGRPSSPSVDGHQEGLVHERPSRRTRVAPDIWQDTLTLLCDGDYAVRADYSEALIFYLTHEMPKYGDSIDSDGVRRVRPLAEGPSQHAAQMNHVLHGGDFGTRFLNAVHAYVYILATASSLGNPKSRPSSQARSMSEGTPDIHISPATPGTEHPTTQNGDARETPAQLQTNGRSSLSTQGPRSRKMSTVQRLLDRAPTHISNSASASMTDYVNIADILTTVHEQLPIRGLLTGIPMLLALDGATRITEVADSGTFHRAITMKGIVARVWQVVGRIWDCPELVAMSNVAISSMPQFAELPPVVYSEVGTYHSPRDPVPFSSDADMTTISWSGVNAEDALMLIVSSSNVQEATGLDRQALLRRFATKWTPESALRDTLEKSNMESVRGDGVSPLLKISPALMHIENISLQSLARSTRSVGVTDLREALEGRSSMSNTALARPSSISTLDHASSLMPSEHPSSRGNQARPRSRSKKRPVPSGSGEVRDVLNKLGIGKQNGSLLKASFPTLQKSDQREPPYKV